MRCVGLAIADTGLRQFEKSGLPLWRLTDYGMPGTSVIVCFYKKPFGLIVDNLRNAAGPVSTSPHVDKEGRLTVLVNFNRLITAQRFDKELGQYSPELTVWRTIMHGSYRAAENFIQEMEI